jgi:hypothetical protein
VRCFPSGDHESSPGSSPIIDPWPQIASTVSGFCAGSVAADEGFADGVADCP